MKNNVKLGLYEHYKGKKYELIGIATHSETKEELAIYRALYGEYGLWARPLSMFLEFVEVNKTYVERFKYLDV